MKMNFSTCWIATERETGEIVSGTYGEKPMDSIRAACDKTGDGYRAFVSKRALVIIDGDVETARGLVLDFEAERRMK